MNGAIDSYSQMRIFLNDEDVRVLEERGQIVGEIWRTDNSMVPLRVYYIAKDRVLQEDLSEDKDFRRRGGYEVYVGKRGLELIKNREVTGTEFFQTPEFFIRKLYISLDGVF